MSKSPMSYESLSETVKVMRRALHDMLPEKVSDLLAVIGGIRPDDPEWRWEHELTDGLVALAVVLPIEESRGYGEPRAYCPLCGRGSNDPYVSGFKVPGGLERHLTGRSADMCNVVSALRHWHREGGI